MPAGALARKLMMINVSSLIFPISDQQSTGSAFLKAFIDSYSVSYPMVLFLLVMICLPEECM